MTVAGDMKIVSSTTNLDVLREGKFFSSSKDSSNNDTCGNLKIPNVNSPRSRAVSLTSSNGSRASNGIRTVDLNHVARRPSDNLLFNSLLENDNELNNTYADLHPPQLNKYINDGSNTKKNRPISNDSIYTRSTEVFSSHSSTGTISRSSSNVEADDMHTNETQNSSLEQPQKTNFYFNATQGSVNHGSYISRAASQPNIPSSENMNYYKKSNTNNQTINNQSNIIKTQIASHHNTVGSTNYNGFKSTPAITEHTNSHKEKPHMPALTPSQRYRLRKVNTESSVRRTAKEKEKYYVENDVNDNLDVDDIDDSLIWDIPMASFSTTSFLNRKKSLKKKGNRTMENLTYSDSSKTSKSSADQNTTTTNIVKNNKYLARNGSKRQFNSNYDFFEMPITPIPGISKQSDLKYIHDTTSNLSSMYLHSSIKLSGNKMSTRAQSVDFLPLEFKENSQNGFEDLLTVSEDKLNLVSNSRPYWLPPKDANEKITQERQISKTISIASIEQLDKNKFTETRMKNDLVNHNKVLSLLEKGLTRNSSIQSLKSIIWETGLTKDIRISVWSQLCQDNEKFVSKHFFESFEDLNSILRKMDFPLVKQREIEKLIENNISMKLSGKYPISDKLLYLLKLKSISKEGVLPGDDLLFHHLLIEYFGNDSISECNTKAAESLLKEIWELVNLFQLICFNDKVKEKYDYHIMDRYGVVGHYIANNKYFQEEYNISCLNIGNFWHILERIDHNLFLWIVDIIIVLNSQAIEKKTYSQLEQEYKGKSWDHYRSKNIVSNYKILLSLTLDVLLNYHFGFNDLIKLSFLEDKNFCIPMTIDEKMDENDVNALFIKKWLHYYKKF
ncbi:hypothetical protein TPHA_0H01640 [Tetrapisispora phaffii CBS 4417]|uniref:Uncharacterized protein n=1 Tax=Tetrapisispora phaffii (strain ATCC 24235 / CBS 4417 / NBRC 1672 / NRRL Y-8282 / UCD 70-5) TaxID=1071381 RepID=G8BX66_TETPH|nr:hypothetical protein TPHA_0H01640 [Tetrapisispora phaffii CBS 4417]CCE64370.1 hypothetical protein TPHA_0H01640 [Tetrapisispora phaffii CBS 4417]